MATATACTGANAQILLSAGTQAPLAKAAPLQAWGGLKVAVPSGWSCRSEERIVVCAPIEANTDAILHLARQGEACRWQPPDGWPEPPAGLAESSTPTRRRAPQEPPCKLPPGWPVALSGPAQGRQVSAGTAVGALWEGTVVVDPALAKAGAATAVLGRFGGPYDALIVAGLYRTADSAAKNGMAALLAGLELDWSGWQYGAAFTSKNRGRDRDRDDEAPDPDAAEQDAPAPDDDTEPDTRAPAAPQKEAP